MSRTYCMHNHCFRTCYWWKIWISHRKFFVPPDVPSWLQVCWWLLLCAFCQLCHSVQSFYNQIFQVSHQILLGEINVKSFNLELYMHNATKVYLRLNRNQNEKRWIGK